MPKIDTAVNNRDTGNPARSNLLARVSNTKIRLFMLGGIAGFALIIISAALIHLIKNPELDNTSMAILVSSMSAIVVAIVGVMAGTSLDSDRLN